MKRRTVLASAAAATLLATGTGLAAFSTTLSVGSIEVLGSPAGFEYSYGLAANGSGTIVGRAWRRDAGDGSAWGERAVRSVGGGAPTALSLPKDAAHPTMKGLSHGYGYDVSENGITVGWYYSWHQACWTCGIYAHPRAVSWDATGEPKVLPGYLRSDGWGYSSAHSISPKGQFILGHALLDEYSSAYVRWAPDGKEPQKLAQPAEHWAYPIDINDEGVVVGHRVYEILDDYYYWYHYRAVRWSADGKKIEDLKDLVPAGATAPVVYNGAAHSVLADGSAVGFQEIDPDGAGPADRRYYAVRWDATGIATDITPAGLTYAVAYDANEAGMVTMYTCPASTGCQWYVSHEGNLEPLAGGWLGHYNAALSEADNNIAFAAGYTNFGSRTQFARWAISAKPSNTAPIVAFASTSVSTSEGSSVVLEPAVTDENPASVMYEWDTTNDDADDFVAGLASLQFTPADNGFFPIRVRVTDGGGLVSEVATVTVAAKNVAPTATFTTSTASLPEGSHFTLTLASPIDPSSMDVAAGFASAFDCGAGSGLGAFAGLGSAPFTMTCATSDDGERSTLGAIRDKDEGTTTHGPTTVTVTNVAPSISQLILPAAPVAINTAVTATAHYGDPGTGDTHTAQFTWDWNLAADAAEATSATTSATGASGKAMSGTSYASAGVYTVRVAVSDDDGGVGSRISNIDVPAYVVVYDPSAGFVTGGGWITSPAGACRLASCTKETTGKATFGFVSRYRKGATTPDGNTEFEFAAGGLRFKSTSYQWLVVAGARGQFKGEGSINGMGGLRFLLTAVDGQVSGGGGTDRFRIKLWRINADGTDGEVVYDNQMDAPDDSDAATAIGGGSIVIHSK